MELDKVTRAIREVLISPNLITLNPLGDKNTWMNQCKAALNLVPYVGGFMAQELQNIEDIRNAEFFRKFTSFILELREENPEKREKFAREIEEKAHDASGNLICGMIDRMDNINKEVVLANLVKARMNGSISIEDFFRLSAVIERIPYIDLVNLPKYCEDYYDESGGTELLLATGALIQTVIDANSNGKYRLSILGEKLLKWGLGIVITVEPKTGTIINPSIITNEEIDRILEEQNPKVEGETLVFSKRK